MIRTYSELIKLPTFEERFRYLKLDGVVGEDTFAWDRYINQMLYKTDRWKSTRSGIIIRDEACDLGVDGLTIFGRVIIHHMNPITLDDIMQEKEEVFDPEFLICVSHKTHNAIHYGDESFLKTMPAIRKPNDTCPWKRSM